MTEANKKGSFSQVLKRELSRMVSRKLYFGVCIVLPLFCIFFMNTIFNTGQIEKVPIGIVDMDQTATSRQIIRTISAVPTSEVTSFYTDPLDARHAVQRKDIYGYLVIPNNFESNLLGGREASLPYYYHFALLSVGVELYSSFESTLKTLSVSPIVKAGVASGDVSQKAIESAIVPVNVEAHPLYNPSLDYSIYLTNPFFFVLFQVIILLVTAYIIGMEMKFKTATEWLDSAGNNIFIAVVGKLLPYTAIFIVMGVLANFVSFGIMNIPMTTNFLTLNLITALFIIATQAFGVFLFCLFPAISIIISILSMVGSLGATLSGVTFPVDDMHPIIHYASYLFPIRHFVETNQNYLYGDYGYAYTWQNVACLFIYLLLAVLILPRLKKAILNHKYDDIE